MRDGNSSRQEISGYKTARQGCGTFLRSRLAIKTVGIKQTSITAEIAVVPVNP